MVISNQRTVTYSSLTQNHSTTCQSLYTLTIATLAHCNACFTAHDATRTNIVILQTLTYFNTRC